ncbi:MAG: hypothetical protein E4H14_05340 [Candidatus Thorarchaeota archaeon]|nr:MAG: hypothetical protein E4H14_05340 [Candidatus Thorarchaeota archaeon]
MNEELAKILETDFDHWVVSPDASKVAAWNNQGKNMIVFDTETGDNLLTIEVEMDRWYWSPNGNDLVSHDHITTCIWDATTGKFLRGVEAMYERPDE